MGGNSLLQRTRFYFKYFTHASNFIKNLSEPRSLPVSHIHSNISDNVPDNKNQTVGAERVLKSEDFILKVSS